jgi:hypothetical protein
MDDEELRIGDLAQAAAGGNERSIRQMLNMAGAELDVDTERPSEQVDLATVRRLYRQRGDESPVGRRLGDYLREYTKGVASRDGEGEVL